MSKDSRRSKSRKKPRVSLKLAAPAGRRAGLFGHKEVARAGAGGFFFQKGTLSACAFFAFFSALFLWPFITHSDWIPGSGDMGFIWVYRHVWIESLKRGYPMLWNPYSSMGQPLLANCNPQDYAPLNFLFFIFPTSYAFTWAYFFHFVIAALGTHLLIRSFGGGWMGACLGGLAFGFSGFFMAHFIWGGHNSINGASWLPLILYGLKRFTDSRKFSALLIASAAFGFCALDGAPQYDLYALMMGGFFLLWAWGSGKIDWKVFLAAALAFIGMGISLGLCQLAPTYQLSFLSERNLWSSENIMRDAFVPANFHFLINPFFAGTPDNYHGTGGYAEVCIYLGLVPFFLALSGFAALWRKPWVLWLGLVAVISMCLAMADTTPLTHYIYLFFSKIIPGFSHNRVPSRIMVLTTLVLACLAGLALDAWSEYWRNKPRLSGFSRSFLAVGIPLLLLLGTAVDLHHFDAKHEVGSGASAFFTDLLPPGILQKVKEDPSYPRFQPASTYCEYQLLQNISSVYTDCTSFFIERSKKYTTEQYYHSDTPLSDLIDLKYSYRPQDSKPTERWKLMVESGTSMWVNSQGYPRAFMVGGYEVDPDYKDVIDNIRDGKVDPRQEVVLAQEPAEKPAGLKGWVGEAQITHYDYNDVEIGCSNEKPCFLFLSDSFYPGWKAWVDGVEKPIYLADGAFRAVPLLSPGRHQVKMSYYPPIIVYSFFYSLAAWIALGTGWIFRKKLDQWVSSFLGTPKTT